MSTQENRRYNFEPTLFKGNEGTDPAAWIRRYELYARLSKWEEEDRIDFMELYMEGKGLLWYNRNKDKMDTWDITKSLFEKEFDGKDGEIRAWTELQTLKYADFSEVSDFEIRLNKLLIKAKITDESVKLKILISAMKPKYQKLVIKSKAENIKKALELIQEEEDLEKIVNSKGISETKEDQFVQKKERTVVKTHKIEDSQDIVKTLIEGFDRLNINIIE
ncbi:hypothetical protein AYI69_g5111, partial [Smittium culicis]